MYIISRSLYKPCSTYTVLLLCFFLSHWEMTNFRTNSFSFFNKYSDILYLLLPNHMLLRSPTRQLHRTCVCDILKNTSRRSSTSERAVDMTFVTHSTGELTDGADGCKMSWTLHPAVVLLRGLGREQWQWGGSHGSLWERYRVGINTGAFRGWEIQTVVPAPYGCWPGSLLFSEVKGPYLELPHTPHRHYPSTSQSLH